MGSREIQRPMHPDRERHFRNMDKMDIRRLVKATDLEDMLFRYVESDPQSIKDSFKLQRVGHEEDPLYNAFMCSAWIGDVIIERIGAEAVCPEHPFLEDFYTGFLAGLKFVNNAVYIGKREKEGLSEDDFEAIHCLTGQPRTLNDVIYERDYAQKAAEVLKGDKTGKSSVRLFYRELAQGKWDKHLDGLVIPFVVKGGHFARQIYKDVFPLTANLEPAA